MSDTERASTEKQETVHVAGHDGLIVMCAWCRKVKQDELWVQHAGDWENDSYMPVTHGVCLECRDRFFGSDLSF